MIQQTEIRRLFHHIEQDIDDAWHTCEENIRFPRNLKESVSRWKRQSQIARTALTSNDNVQIHSCLDELQREGKKAQAASEEIIGFDHKIRHHILHANSELAELKWQLH